MKYTNRKLLAALVMSAFLSACASTKIHLFKQGVSVDELNQIESELKHQGFSLHLTNLYSPDFDGPTLIYSPAHPHIADIEKITTTLSKHGYSYIDLVAVSKNNHSYTGKNVGLYLGQPDTNKTADTRLTQSKAFMPTEFAGRCGVDDAYLNLNPNGEFVIDIVGWDVKETVISLAGNWKNRQQTLELDLDGSVVQFKIENSKSGDRKNRFRRIQISSSDGTNPLANCVLWYSDDVPS